MTWKRILKDGGMEDLTNMMLLSLVNYYSKYYDDGSDDYVKETVMNAKDTHSRAKTLLGILNSEERINTEEFDRFSDDGRKGLLEQRKALFAIGNMKLNNMTLDEMV
tara:strand:+ start:311 stop:631 length:321 start_codon:yes stop_codon:yes gene_type:complete